MRFKVTFIGAGSIGFTRRLVTDLMSVPEFRGELDIWFMDINPMNLDMVTRLCRRDMAENGLDCKIHATLDRREALKDAKYVICCARIGLLDAFKLDVEIPLKYGVDQCVGDTLCIGGIMYGQRGIAQILDFCKDMREVSRPDVLFLNYSNPNAMLTWAAFTDGHILRHARIDDFRAEASGLLTGVRPDIRGIDDGAEAFGRGNRLKAADAGADNQNIGGLNHTDGAEDLRYELREIVGREHHALVSGNGAHGRQGIHSLGTRDARNTVERQADNAFRREVFHHFVIDIRRGMNESNQDLARVHHIGLVPAFVFVEKRFFHF